MYDRAPRNAQRYIEWKDTFAHTGRPGADDVSVADEWSEAQDLAERELAALMGDAEEGGRPRLLTPTDLDELGL